MSAFDNILQTVRAIPHGQLTDTVMGPVLDFQGVRNGFLNIDVQEVTGDAVFKVALLTKDHESRILPWTVHRVEKPLKAGTFFHVGFDVNWRLARLMIEKVSGEGTATASAIFAGILSDTEYGQIWERNGFTASNDDGSPILQYPFDEKVIHAMCYSLLERMNDEGMTFEDIEGHDPNWFKQNYIDALHDVAVALAKGEMSPDDPRRVGDDLNAATITPETYQKVLGYIRAD